MRLLIGLILLCSMTSSFSKESVSQIHDIDPAFDKNEDTFIYLTTGQVLKLNQTNKLTNKLKEGLKNRTFFHFVFNDNHQIQSIKPIHSIPLSEKSNNKISLFHTTQSLYKFSIIKNLEIAKEYFFNSQINPKESQCFNRAHAWAYDWRVKNNLYSSKVWLFFTKRYIRKHQFEWWFHVAPMVHVLIDNQVKERVMDIKYARSPLKLKSWTDIFIRDSSHCPVITKYSEQADFPESGSCFILKSSMYYYQPVDLEQLEIKGIEKTFWIEPEVKAAFLDAFDTSL